MDEKTRLMDWRFTEVGRQNWEVCHRMLIHDLVDLHIPQVDKVLAYYHISVLPNGAHSAALPRLHVVGTPKAAKPCFSKAKPQISKKGTKYIHD